MNKTKIGMNRKNCTICTRTIATNHRTINCISCHTQIHIKCNHTDIKNFNKIIKQNIPQVCFKCESQNLPFSNLSNNQFPLTLQIKSEKSCKICKRTIAKNHRFINCQKCNAKVHIKCNQTDDMAYNKITQDKIPQLCFNCNSCDIPFHNLPDSDFFAIIDKKGESGTN